MYIHAYILVYVCMSSDIQSVFFFLLHSHIVNIKKHFCFSGEVKDTVIFSLFFT